jgi:hypothetical protein
MQQQQRRRDLLKVEPSIGRSQSQLRNLRQHVKITGLGQPTFDESVKQLSEIHTMFKETIAAGTVLPLEFVPYEGHGSIESHARYFTDRELVPYETNNDFLTHGVLAKAQPDSFIHAMDNQVEYCTMMIEDDNEVRYVNFKSTTRSEEKPTCLIATGLATQRR